jgi:hypothetical protein
LVIQTFGQQKRAAVQGFTAQATIADVDAQTVDTSYGQPEADVIASLRTKLNTLLAELEAAGILASS